MPGRPPPPRYRVVERGRRLEVIDTATGLAAKPAPRAVPPADGAADRRRWPGWPEQQGFDGRALLVTHRWYDDRAPRRLLIDSGTMEWLERGRIAGGVAVLVALALAAAMPAALLLLLPLLALARPAARARWRAAITRRLDGFDPPPAGR